MPIKNFWKNEEEERSYEAMDQISSSPTATPNSTQLPTPWQSSVVRSKVVRPPTDWLVHGFFPTGSITLIAAREGAMKTWFSLWLASSLSNGYNFIGRSLKSKKVLYVDAEGPVGLLEDRLKHIGISDNLNIWAWWDEKPPPTSFSDPIWVQAADAHDLIIIDTLKRFMDGADENDSGAMAKLTRELRPLTKKSCSIILLHHKGKMESEYRGSTELGAGVDIVLTMKKIVEGVQAFLEIKSYKHRWVSDFSLKLQVIQGEDVPRFEDITRKEEQSLAQKQQTRVQQTQGIIESLKKETTPNQSAIIKRIIDDGLLESRPAVQRFLENGNGKYWTFKSKGRGHEKIYENLPTCSDPREKTGEQVPNKDLFDPSEWSEEQTREPGEEG